MRRKIYSLVLILLVLFLVLMFFIIKKNKKSKTVNETNEIENVEYNLANDYYNYILDISNHLKKNATNEEKEIIYNYIHYPRNAITEMCKKNGNWELIPIGDEIYNRYNEKDGILADQNFDKIEGIDENNPDGMAQVVITKGKEKVKYIISFVVGYLIEDIKIFEETLLVDKNGIEQDTRYKFIDDRIAINFNVLCSDGVVWDDGDIIGSDIAVTDKFRKKYPLFLDLFIHYSPLDYNSISFVESKSDLSKNMAYFIVDSVLECKKREYEVYYTLDKDKYLDDAKARLVKEINLDKTSENKYGSSNAFYKNSNIDIDFYSDNFKKKLQQKGSYFPDIDLVDINYTGEAKSIKKYECVYCLHMKTGQINSYYIKFIMDNDNRIDDTIVERLPYTNMSAEEVKELYLKEYNK